MFIQLLNALFGGDSEASNSKSQGTYNPNTRRPTAEENLRDLERDLKKHKQS